MGCELCHRLVRARSDQDPSLIADLDECSAVLCDNQGSRGWCVLILKRHVEHLDELDVACQQRVFGDVARIGAAIRRVFGPVRLNYECLGNQVPHVHWHIIPRHADDPTPRQTVWGWTPGALQGSMTDDARAILITRLRAALEPHEVTVMPKTPFPTPTPTIPTAAPGSLTATRYRWSDLPQDRPMELIARRRVIGEKAMLSYVNLTKGFSVGTHAHENEQIACVLSGRVRFGIGVEGSRERHELIVEGGEVLLLPANVPHSAFAIEDSVVLDVFSPPSAATGIDKR